MPDKHGFNHLPHWGETFHQCIECEWPGFGHVVSEPDRARHARQHERDRKREVERKQRENLAEGRRLKRQAEREDRLARGE